MAGGNCHPAQAHAVNQKTGREQAASVRQGLIEKARLTGLSANLAFHYFAVERFLFRLSKSRYAKNFVLKGALMFQVWEKGAPPRPTLDINLLGRYVSNDVDALILAVQEIGGQTVEPDGIWFDPSDIQANRITVESGYQTVRMRFQALVANVRQSLQLDVGFGDVVVPADAEVNYPSLLDFPAPRIQGYTRESMIAEKFETAIRLGIFNTRVKDFFDIWRLSRQFPFEGPTLSLALKETFSRRKTDLPANPFPLTPNFARSTDQGLQWRAFRRGNSPADAPDAFAALMAQVTEFLAPLGAAISENRPFRGSWNPPGPWRAGD